MSKKIEQALKRAAEAKGIQRGTPRWNRYIYGTLAKIKKSKEQPSGH